MIYLFIATNTEMYDFCFEKFGWILLGRIIEVNNTTDYCTDETNKTIMQNKAIVWQIQLENLKNLKQVLLFAIVCNNFFNTNVLRYFAFSILTNLRSLVAIVLFIIYLTANKKASMKWRKWNKILWHLQQEIGDRCWNCWNSSI